MGNTPFINDGFRAWNPARKIYVSHTYRKYVKSSPANTIFSFFNSALIFFKTKGLSRLSCKLQLKIELCCLRGGTLTSFSRYQFGLACVVPLAQGCPSENVTDK